MQRVRTIIVSVMCIVGMIAAFLSGWLARAAAMEGVPVALAGPKVEPPVLTDAQVRTLVLTDAQVRTLGVMVGVGVDRGVRAGVRDALEKQMPWGRPSA